MSITPPKTVRVSPSVLVICATIIVVVIVGSFVRLQVAHNDTASYINFLTTIVVIGIPSIAGWYQSWKARKHAVNAEAQSSQAASQTNGILDAKFLVVRKDIADLTSIMGAHLKQHESEAPKP
jgi:Na+/melibiose symporter-like transporter